MDETLTGPKRHEDRMLDQRLARLNPAQRALLEQRLKAEPSSGHRLVARTLGGLGVTHVYGVPGQPVYDTFGACAGEGIRLIGTHHQQSAALMAGAHNYFAGQQKAVSMVSTGAPATNALSAVVVARDNRWPIVVLAGAAPLTADGAGYFMALDAARLYRPVTKWATRVPETAAIPTCIAKAFEVAMNGRPGPVLVELPEDVLTGLTIGTGTPQLTNIERTGHEADPTVLKNVATALMSARRPLLIVGEGVRWASPFAELRELIDALALPFITSPIGDGAIPDDHLLCMNVIPWIAQSQADVVLLVGARLDWTFRYGTQLAAEAMVIQVDIDVPEFDCNRRIDLGVHADPGCFLRALLKETDQVERSEAQAGRDHAWLLSLRALRRKVQTEREAQAGSDECPISPLRLAREIRDALPIDAISIFDGNLTLAACRRMIGVHTAVSRLTPGPSGCLGIGIPYAIAAKLAHPERPVVAICGDFAFGVTVMELETAVRHNVPIVIVVANNNGNGGSLRQRMHMCSADAEPIMMFQSGLRYDKIAEVLGAFAEHVEHARDIGPALTRAIASNRPACINIAVDANAPFPSD